MITKEKAIEEYGEDVVSGYIDNTGDNELKDFEEAHQGKYTSDEDFAQNMAEELGEIPRNNVSWPHYCIDWEWASRELMMDYFEVNGHYFRNL